MWHDAKTLTTDMHEGKTEYALYFPLFHAVKSMEIGISEGSAIEKAPPRTQNIKPVVFYGSSITEGGCGSRPGMAYPAILGVTGHDG